MSEVKIVRFQSGEEIICKLTKESEGTDEVYTLKHPAIIIPAGEGRVALAPYLPYCELENNSIQVSSRFVMFVVDPVTEFKNQYNTAFGSGIVVPDQNMAMAAAPMGADTPSLKLTD